MSVDWTKPIQTEDGRKARLLGELKTSSVLHESRVVAIECPDGHEWGYTVFEDGRCCRQVESTRNIINVPPRKVMRDVEAWAIIDGEDHEIMLATFNKAIADRNAGTSIVVRLTGTYEVEAEG